MSMSVKRCVRAACFGAGVAWPALAALAADDVATLAFNNRTWSNPTAWTHSNPAFNGTVPNNSAQGTYDVVVQRTVDLDLDVTVGKGTLDGGQISDSAAGPNTLRFSDLFNFRNGFLQPNTTAAGGILFDNPTGNPFIERGVLTSLGTATWTGGDLTTLDGGRLDIPVGSKLVSHNPNDDDAFFVDIESIFDLRGLLEKLGPHDITFTRNFLNNGNVMIAQGGVRTAGAGQTSGRWSIDALANWTITSGTHVMHDGARVEGDGVLHVLQAANLQIGGATQPTANVEIKNLRIDRGTLDVRDNATLRFLNRLIADRAPIVGPGVLQIAPGAAFDIDLHSGPMSITETVVESEGTTTITGGGSNSLALQNGARLFIRADGQLNIHAPATLASISAVPGNIFNEGTTRFFTTPQGGLITLLNVDVINRGTIELPLGATVRILDADYDQQSGQTTIERDALLEIVNGLVKLGGGTMNLAGTVTGQVRVAPAPGSSAYVTLHNDSFPDGQIRGQLSFTPSDSVGGESFLMIDVRGRNQGQNYDVLRVTEEAALGGNLVVELRDGFENQILQSDVFTILTAGSITGAFDNVANGARLADVDGLGTFRVNYGPGSPFDPSDIVLSDFVFIPEPGGVTVTCVFGALLTRRRRAA
jgi:hypothetical protein